MSYTERGFVPQPLRIPPPAWRTRAEKIAARAHEILLKRKDALSYLARRGVGLGVVKRFKIGLVPREIYEDPKAWGLDSAIYRRVWIPQGILIPCWRNGHLLRLRIRQKIKSPKYVVISGSTAAAPLILSPKSLEPSELEGWQFDRAIVTESELDAFLLWKAAGGRVLTIGLGASTIRPDVELHEALRLCRRILFIPDYDDAGKQAARWWMATYPQTEIWPVPSGKDPGEFFQQAGPAAVRAWLKAGLK